MRGDGGTPGLGLLPVAYRGYTLLQVRPGTPTETIQIRYGADLISLVPTMDKARQVIDEWLEAK